MVECISSPAFELEDISPTSCATHQGAVIFTSVHAVKRAIELGISWTGATYCVGSSTAAAAEQAGFEVFNAGGTNNDLLRLIQRLAPSDLLLHISGKQVATDLVGDLKMLGFTADRLVVYQQIEMTARKEFIQALEGTSSTVLPLFSPRSARILDRVVIGDATHIIAMSDPVAAAIKNVPFDRVEIVNKPTLDMMLEATCSQFCS